jgi:hypothetical protein
MNLLSMGFPVNLLITFFLLFLIIPQLMEAFAGMVDTSFVTLDDFFRGMSGQGHRMAGAGADAPAAVQHALTHVGAAAPGVSGTGAPQGGAVDQAVQRLQSAYGFAGRGGAPR